MANVRKFLVLVAVVLVVAVVGRFVWALLVSGFGNVITTIGSLVPVWVWWVVAGIAVSQLLRRRFHMFGCCGSRYRCDSGNAPVSM